MTTKGVDVDLAEFFAVQVRPPRCATARAIAKLSDDQAAKFAVAMTEPRIQHVTLVKVLREWIGADAPSEPRVIAHRNGKCGCQTK